MPGGDVRYFPLAYGRVDEKGNDVPPPVAALPAAQPATQPVSGGDAKPSGQPAGQAGQQQAPALPPARDAGRLAASLRKAIVTAAGRCLRKEAAEAVKAAKKPDGFVSWVDGFYAKHAEMLAESLNPLVEAWAEAFGVCYYHVDEHARRSKGELLTAAECKPAELVAAVERVTERWTGERLAEIGAELQPESMALEG
jgi:hypothetical protein